MRRYGKRPPLRPRPGKTDTLRRLARLARERENEDFDPERPRERYAQPHHFAVNMKGGYHDVDAHTTVWVSGDVPTRVITTLDDQARVDRSLSDWWGSPLYTLLWKRTRAGYEADVAQDPIAHRRNHHHSLSGGLHDQPELLRQLVQMDAEYQAEEDPSFQPADADFTDEVYDEAKRFDAALAVALDEVVRRFPPKGGATADDLWDADAPYLVLMTLRGEGVGIWDGSWDAFYDDTDDVEALLKKRLGAFVDDTGSGTLSDEIHEAAFKTAAPERYAEEFEPNTALGPQWSPRRR